MANRKVVGRHSVFEVLKVRPYAVTKLCVSERIESKKWFKEFMALSKRLKVPVQTKKEGFFTSLAENAQGIMCEVNEEPAWPDLNQDKVFILALDKVEDPHNLGAIMRTAWLLGVDGILISDRDSAPLSATACKVASGGAEHIPLRRVKNLKNEISEMKDLGFWSYALALDEGAQKLGEVTQSEKTILVAGAEETGIRPSLIEDSDFKVYIPQADPAASLNVSVSVALGVWALK